MIADALFRRLLQARRKEEPETVREYIREAFYRDAAGLPQEDPNVFFGAPPGWEAPAEAQEVHDALEGGFD